MILRMSAGLPGLSNAAPKGGLCPGEAVGVVLEGQRNSRALTASFVSRRTDGAAVPDRETLQIATAPTSAPEFPLVPRADHNPQRRSHHHQQEGTRFYEGRERGHGVAAGLD